MAPRCWRTLRAGWLLAALAGCSAGPLRLEQAARVPAADRLFRLDPRWRGGDAAYSIDLGGERSVWLFGDSFVARPGAVGRQGCAMVRNSAALQTGADPATATMEFAWGGDAAAPRSWVPEEGDRWFWPIGGLRIGDSVVLFCTVLRSTGESSVFGFRAEGSAALRFTGVDGPLAQWRRERLLLAAPPFAAVIGTAVVADGDHVCAYVLREPGDHAVFLVRWSRAAFAAGELDALQWFDAGVWRPAAEVAAAPAPLFAPAAPEFSVHALDGQFVMVESVGFGATELAIRTAPAPEGPWSAPRTVFRPSESDRTGLLVYAGKAHAQLRGTGLMATYVANAVNFGELVRDDSIYWPRFVALPWPRRPR